MASFEGLRLSPYYLNSRRLGLPADINFSTDAKNLLVQNSGKRVQAMRDVCATAETALQDHRRCCMPKDGFWALFPDGIRKQVDTIGGAGRKRLANFGLALAHVAKTCRKS
jgi:hypothetical protein